ncbi:MAG: gamma-glutamylcyclotransferase [bacterium]|nr:gamma-glutamylcyclotransferase [bacterium]
MNASDPLIFVYGTLRTAVRDPQYRMLNTHTDFLSFGSFQGIMHDLGSYPGVVPSDQEEDRVIGEVYTLIQPDKVLPILDDYEGPEYSREQHTVSLDDGEEVTAWMYIYTAPVHDKPRIESGDFLNRE